MDLNIPVFKLKIKLSLSVDNKVDDDVVFTYSMLSPPETQRLPAIEKDANSPYYTNYVRYPTSLQSRLWQDNYAFFFNRDIFRKTVTEIAQNDASAYVPNVEDASERNKWMKETEINNIMIMLRCIFRISEQSGVALSDSYSVDIMGMMNPRILSDMDPVDSVWSFLRQFGITSAKRDFYMKVGGEKYLITNVKWQNDIASHPKYAKFIESYDKAIRDIKDKTTASGVSDEQEKFDKSTKKLNEKLTDTNIKLLISDLSNNMVRMNPQEKLYGDAQSILDKLTLLLPPSSTNTTKVEGEDAAKIIIQIRDLIEIQTLKSERYSSTQYDDRIKQYDDEKKYDLFFHSEEKAKFKSDFYDPAIAIMATRKVLNFITENEIMRLEDVQRDGTLEKRSTKDINKYIKDNFGKIANDNDTLINTLRDVSAPVRKSSNAELYTIIENIKYSRWPSDNANTTATTSTANQSNPKESEKDKQLAIFRNVYKTYIASNPSAINEELDIGKYMYSGVDEINPPTDKKDDKNILKEDGQSYEIYVQIDLARPDTLTKSCEYNDTRTSQHFKSLVDPLRRKPNNLDAYREQEPPSNKPKTEVKEPPVKMGGAKYTRKTRLHNRARSYRRL